MNASIKTIKYLNGLLGRLTVHRYHNEFVPENVGDSIPTLAGVGLIINFAWVQTSHDNSLD